jgi:hypothetical protein
MTLRTDRNKGPTIAGARKWPVNDRLLSESTDAAAQSACPKQTGWLNAQARRLDELMMNKEKTR